MKVHETCQENWAFWFRQLFAAGGAIAQSPRPSETTNDGCVD